MPNRSCPDSPVLSKDLLPRRSERPGDVSASVLEDAAHFGMVGTVLASLDEIPCMFVM